MDSSSSVSHDHSALLNSTTKELSDCMKGSAAFLPSIYFTRSLADAESEPVANEEIPTIDFFPLQNGTSDDRAKIVDDIRRACEDWGCFNLVNHGISERLRMAMMEAFAEFFNLTEEEKEDYKIKNPFDPICHGTSTNLMGTDVRFWRDFLRVFVYPEFNYPTKPHNFREISEEYASKTRDICNELLRAIWESLELDESFMEESLGMKFGSQTLVGNLYPPCPQPELVLGLPPHSDPCFLTLLMQNTAYNGLQIMHNGEWVIVEPIPHSLLFLTGDIIEIVSNGRYKGVTHRAMVSTKSTRISVGTSLTPPLDNVIISPAPKLLENSNSPIAFRRLTFKDYVLLKYQMARNSPMDLIKDDRFRPLLKNIGIQASLKENLLKEIEELSHSRSLALAFGIEALTHQLQE